jgi:lysophospholipase L1-like esterase
MKYEFWSAQLAQKMGDDISFYNAGLGWARASDASKCGDWLERAKKYETVLVAFGTNDIGAGEYNVGKNNADEIKGFLTTIIDELKDAGCNVILFNSPPQGYKGKNETTRTELNEIIPKLAEEKGIYYFDFAGLLCDTSDPATPLYGGHPNGEAGKLVSDKLLEQFADLMK